MKRIKNETGKNVIQMILGVVDVPFIVTLLHWRRADNPRRLRKGGPSPTPTRMVVVIHSIYFILLFTMVEINATTSFVAFRDFL